MATLAQIRTRCYQRANRVNATDRFPPSEVDQYINDSYRELWALLLKHSLIRVEAQETITTDGSSSYALDSSHFSTVNVWRKDSSTQYSLLKRHTSKDRLFGSDVNVTGDAYSYRVIKESVSGVVTKKIELYPKPTSGDYIVVYVPVPELLADDADTLDSVLGWDEYIVNDVAIKMLLRDRAWDDIRYLKREKDEIRMRIQDEAEMQELSQTLKIADSRRPAVTDPGDVWWGTNGDI